MSKSRLEAFSDGVLAIVITIMVLGLRIPATADWQGLSGMASDLLAYGMSFAFVGIYWVNHHHLLQAVQKVNGPVLWGNLHLLFWLSLVPFVTTWLGRHIHESWPMAAYGMNLLGAGLAYFILVRSLLKLHGNKSTLARAIGADLKGKLSLLLYLLAMPLAFWHAEAAFIVYVLVALVWVIPDRRIERILEKS